jgi:hypothetical protein
VGFLDLIKIGAVSFVVLIVIVVAILGYTGFVPGLSDLMGTNKPRDLGVSFSQADYASGLAKVPGVIVENPQYLCVVCEYTSTGSITVDETFSQEEFTAMFNKRNSELGPIQDAQFKFNEDGTLEASAMINHPKLSGPIYAKGNVTKTSSRGVKIDLDYAEFGRVGIPEDQMPLVDDIISTAIQQTFDSNPGLSIESIEIVEGGVNFKGTLPETTIGNPNTIVYDIE